MPLTAVCPECDTPIDPSRLKVGDIIVCPSCGRKLRVVAISVSKVYFETQEEEGPPEKEGWEL